MVNRNVHREGDGKTANAGRRRRLSIGFLAILVLAPVLLRSGVIELSDPPASAVTAASRASAATFTFAAAGDIGANGGLASFADLDQSGVVFFLALGDLDYDQTPTDEAWCDYVKQHLPTLGPEFPFELLVGSHEDQDGQHGYILNHAACLPDKLGSTGTYAVHYYFDYPASSPLIRFIMIPPNMRVENVLYNYTPDSPHYTWLSSTIDDARTAGIPWVAVGMHDVCITTGVKTCEIGSDLMNLLISKRVDLVLQAHDHNYQRSKQLRFNAGVCAAVPAGSFDANCVVDSGADGLYAKGAGSVFVISGNFGHCCYAVDAADPEAGYFARFDSTSRGFTKYTVGPGHIDAQFVNSIGDFTDSFSIVSNQDSDADGFTNGVESYAGTNPNLGCGIDAWPPDFNSDSFVTGFDLSAIVWVVGQNVPPAPARRDIGAPVDRAVTGLDLSAVAGRIGRSCN